MPQTTRRIRPPPTRLLRVIYEHHRWLESDGMIGERLGSHEEVYDFSALDLEGVDLSLGILNSSQFDGSRLRNAWLIRARLSGATFRNADLVGARFDDAEMHAACVAGADYSGAIFDGVDRTAIIWTAKEDGTLG